MVRERKEEEEPTVFGVEEAIAKIAIEQMKPEGEKLFTITDLMPEEVFGIALLNRYAEILNSDVMKNWIRDFLLLRISRWRMGRKENLVTLTGIREIVEEKRKAKVTDLYAGLR